MLQASLDYITEQVRKENNSGLRETVVKIVRGSMSTAGDNHFDTLNVSGVLREEIQGLYISPHCSQTRKLC